MCLKKEKSIPPQTGIAIFKTGWKEYFQEFYRNQMTSSKKVWVFAVLDKGKLISAESKAYTWKEEKFTI